MTSKERIAELERKVEELEKKLSGYWLLDKNSPNLVTFPTTYHCHWCHKDYDNSRMHWCPNQPTQLADPNGFFTIKIT